MTKRMTSEEMIKNKGKLPTGYIYQNMAPLGKKPAWEIIKAPPTWGKITTWWQLAHLRY